MMTSVDAVFAHLLVSIWKLTSYQIIRETIGYERRLMVDANQRWDVQEAISNMIEVKFQLLYIFQTEIAR